MITDETQIKKSSCLSVEIGVNQWLIISSFSVPAGSFRLFVAAGMVVV
jgi:hypothetical protein